MRVFSYKNRPVHLGPYPLERLARTTIKPDLAKVPETQPLHFSRSDEPESLVNAMRRYITMLDLVRDGKVMHNPAEIPQDPELRSQHVKAAGYYFDASQVGICALSDQMWLQNPITNPHRSEIQSVLEEGQPNTYAAGIDQIYAEICESAQRELTPPTHHTHAIVFLIEYTREPRPEEAGTDWIHNAQAERAAVLGSLVGTIISSYLHLLGFSARAHSATESDVDLNKLAVAAGLATVNDSVLENPYLGTRFGLAVVTTDCALAPDQPLKPLPSFIDRLRSHGPSWWLGKNTFKSARDFIPFAKRDFRQGAFPFERIKRVNEPTTLVDEDRVPRFPKRADYFARATFGDMGRAVQDCAKGGMFIMKSPIGACARKGLGALLLLQFGDARGSVSSSANDPARNAANLKGAS